MSATKIAQALIQRLRIATAEISDAVNAQIKQITGEAGSDAGNAAEILQLRGWDNASAHGTHTEAGGLDHPSHKFTAVEEIEVLDLLARADEARRNLQLVLDGDDHAAFA
jgi:hypothetical protein